MTTRSIIDIEVDDSKFRRFKADFQKYTEQLKATPGLWAKAGDEQDAIGKQFEKMAAAMAGVSMLNREGAEDSDKQEKTLTTSERLWTSIGRSTKDVAKNVVGATAALLRWTGILSSVSGLLGAGGLYGIDRMAASVGNDRRRSSGLGLSIGQEKAFGQSLGRIVDPGAYLGWVNSMELDVSKQGPAYALQHGRGLSGDTSADAVSLLKNIRALAQTLPLNQLQTTLHGYGLELSDSNARLLKTTPGAEFNQLLSSYATDSRAENVGDNTAKSWQDFTEQMQRAGGTISKVFVEGLVKLEQPLEHLSAGFTHLVQVLMRKNGAVSNAIEHVATWLEHFSGEVTAPKFMDSVKSFTSDIGDLAHMLHLAVHPGEALAEGAVGYAKWALKTDTMGLVDINKMHDRSAFLAHPDKATYLALLAEADQQFKLPAGTLERQWQAESSSRFNPPDSRTGAIGAFQFMPATAKSLGIDPHDPLQSMYGAGSLDAGALARFHGDLAMALASYNWGGLPDAVAKYGAKDWFNHAPKETQGYVISQGGRANGTDVIISNNTGGSATVAVTGLAY